MDQTNPLSEITPKSVYQSQIRQIVEKSESFETRDVHQTAEKLPIKPQRSKYWFN